jgi:hypothetical protein
MLVADNQEKDLGTLKFGKAHNFTYNLTNNSTSSVQITKLVKGCGSCTKASINHSSISPNSNAIINVEFTPGSTGINKKTIQVLYNDNQNLTLSFKAFVEK